MNNSTPPSESILTEIIPHQGIPGLPFGSTKAEIKARLGEPDEVDRYTDSDGFTSESWHYDEIDLSLVIEEAEDWRLTTFAVSGEQFVVNNFKIIGATDEAALKFFNAAGLGEVQRENWLDDDEDPYEVLNIPDAFLNLWLKEGIVTEVQWGAPYNDEDEIVWPE